MSGANLEEADLSQADLRGASLYGTNLRGANLHGARVSTSAMDAMTNLAQVCIDRYTKFGLA